MSHDFDEAPGSPMTHYFDEAPDVGSREVELSVDLGDGRPAFSLRTDRGVFSHGRVDPGTDVLLRRAPRPPVSGALLDLGCGAGPIALAMARWSPAATVWAVDVNERARRLCEANAARNEITNVTVLHPDGVDAGLRFRAVWSNPPIRIGKTALHELLSTWFSRLTDDGTGLLVVHKHLGADSLQRWLIAEGWSTKRLASANGYRILRSRPS